MICILAQSASAAAQQSLTDDRKNILGALKTACRDSWCEGFYQLDFQNIVYVPASNSTQIFFRMSHQGDSVRIKSNDPQSFEAQINSQYHDVFCTIREFSDYDSIMLTQNFLQPAFTSKLNACIEAIQGRLFKIRHP